MKTLVSIAILGSTLAAQVQQPPVKIPREPSTGRQEKITEYVPPKNGVEATPATPAVTNRELPVEHKPAADAARSVVANFLADPNLVLIDQPQADGAIWARGSNYKASFDDQGWSFIAQPLHEAPGVEPIHFQLAGARVGTKVLGVSNVMPTRNDHRLQYMHGDVVEAIDVSGRGVEQSFTFASLPQRGELVLTLDIKTDLAGQMSGGNLVFSSAYDNVSYSQAVAIDANGDRVAAETTLANGQITIRVPANFVEQAQLPLVIDPRIVGQTVHTDATHDLGNPDVAWDESSGTWGVVFQQFFAVGDWDCYVQRLDNALNLVGGVTTIDFTGNAWQRPRIANLNQYDKFMVVAEVRIGANPVKVSGRIMDNAGVTTTAQFDIATSGVDELNPDIGGDPTTAPPTYFTVVWEHAFSATDHDIYARQIDNAGALRPGPIFIQTNTTFQSHPSISKSDGAAPFGTQRYTIVYQQTFGPTDEDIYGAMLTWDGVIVTVGGSNTFLIDFSSQNDTWPQASSPTLTRPAGNRQILTAYERTTINNGDIQSTCIDETGAILARADIQTLENNATRQGWPQFLPSVDSDGARFVVGYHELFNGAGGDLDTRVSLIALVGGALVAQEAGVFLAFSTNPEFNIQVASQYSGNAAYSFQYNTVNDRDGPGGAFFIDAWRYNGLAPGGISTRATQCGTLTMSTSGTAVIGDTIQFTVNSGPFLAGVVAGFPATLPIAPCPLCTLGVNGNGLVANPFNLTIPLDPQFVGVTVSIQGFDFAFTGPCLNAISLTDTVDVTVR